MRDLQLKNEFAFAKADFPTFFQYKIGTQQHDNYVYFLEKPSLQVYYDGCFTKLLDYTGYRMVTFLDFHYSSYMSPVDFLDFLQYEISYREKLISSYDYQLRLQTAKDWVKNKRAVLLHFTHESTEYYSHNMEQLFKDIKENFSAITEKLPTGRIELNNRNHEDVIIQVFILLQQVIAPAYISKGEQLFKRFTAVDIATMLNLHFEAFQHKKINTIQRKVGEQLERLKPNHPKVKALVQALQEFFY